MTPETDGEVASVPQDFFAGLPEEVVTRIMKYYYMNHIRGVLLLDYISSLRSDSYDACHPFQAYEIHWFKLDKREYYAEPMTFITSLPSVQTVLKTRHVNKLFARCMLEAFFTSPIVFQHATSELHGTRPIWFLPCQIEPRLVQNGTPIKAEFRNPPMELFQVLKPETNIQCTTTAIDLALSREMHLPTIKDVDACLLASETNRVFIHKRNGLVLRGIQFTGDLEKMSFFPCI
jgi:hypothetical protein